MSFLCPQHCNIRKMIKQFAFSASIQKENSIIVYEIDKLIKDVFHFRMEPFTAPSLPSTASSGATPSP
jgi:hypothetical protein